MHILADIGGTKMRIAGSQGFTTFSEPIILNTPRSYDEGIKAVADVMKTVANGQKVQKIVIGRRGIIAHDKQSVLQDRSFPDWAQKPLVADVSQALKADSVHLENDMELVGLGEAVHGAGEGVPIVVYITVSTGVGGSRIVDGRIDRFSQGFEPGGQYISMDAMLSVEEMVSGAAVQKRFGVHPKELGKDNPVWEELARILAFGVHNSILHWSPDRVVLGGSMFNEIGISVERVAAHVKDIMRKFPEVPEIVHASLGDLGGLWGGLALLKQEADPKATP